MTDAQALKQYRILIFEMTALQEQIRQAERAGMPRGVLTQRYDAIPGTNDPSAAARQLLDGLEALAQRKQQEIDALRPQIDNLLNSISDFRTLIILQQYYLNAQTDEQISQLMNLSDRYICRIRNAFVRSLAHNRTSVSSPVHSSAQKSSSPALSSHTILC